MTYTHFIPSLVKSFTLTTGTFLLFSPLLKYLRFYKLVIIKKKNLYRIKLSSRLVVVVVTVALQK